VELRKLLCHAFKTVPFYNKKYTYHGFNTSSFTKFELEDLPLLPVLSKQDLRKFGTTTLISSKKDKKGAFFSSSGSTGTPTKILYSKTMHQRWTACFESRVKNWAGVSHHNIRGMIGGRRIVPEGLGKPPFYRWNIFEKQVYFSAYHIAPANVENYLEGMKKHGVEYMMGYAMSNFFIAKFLLDSGFEVPRLKAVVISSEKLTPEMRQIFEQTYQCRAFDTWSSVEACGQISECEHGSLHISPDIGILEFLNKKNQNAVPGEQAEIVCTGLLNQSQPLIRYRISDIAILSQDKCPCGREMPTVKDIGGRIEDIITGKDGRKMVRFHGIFINIPKIKEAQVIQHTLQDFEILIKTDEPLLASEEAIIQQRMESQLGVINLKISSVQEIPKGQNGKFKAVISHLNWRLSTGHNWLIDS